MEIINESRIQNYLDRIINLWHEAFRDGPEYVKDYINSFYNGRNCYLMLEEQRLLSMLHYIDFTAQIGEQSFKCAYLYAVATAESERGKGRLTQMHEKLVSDLKKQGFAFIFLVPGSVSVSDMYKNKFGYEFLFEKEYIHTKEIPPGFKPFENDYKRLYDLYLKGFSKRRDGFYIKKDYNFFQKSIYYALEDGFKVSLDEEGYIIHEDLESHILREKLGEDNGIVIYENSAENRFDGEKRINGRFCMVCFLDEKIKNAANGLRRGKINFLLNDEKYL